MRASNALTIELGILFVIVPLGVNVNVDDVPSGPPLQVPVRTANPQPRCQGVVALARRMAYRSTCHGGLYGTHVAAERRIASSRYALVGNVGMLDVLRRRQRIDTPTEGGHPGQLSVQVCLSHRSYSSWLSHQQFQQIQPEGRRGSCIRNGRGSGEAPRPPGSGRLRPAPAAPHGFPRQGPSNGELCGIRSTTACRPRCQGRPGRSTTPKP